MSALFGFFSPSLSGTLLSRKSLGGGYFSAATSAFPPRFLESTASDERVHFLLSFPPGGFRRISAVELILIFFPVL